MPYVAKSYVYSSKAIDYSKGTTIIDLKTNKTYTNDEAKQLPPEIRSRLVNKPNKIGCYVVKEFMWIDEK